MADNETKAQQPGTPGQGPIAQPSPLDAASIKVPESARYDYGKDRLKAIAKIIGAVVAVVIVVGLVYNFVFNAPPQVVNTTTVALPYTELNSCALISTPGVYHIVGDISTSATNGACIDVLSSGVSIIGGGHSITGNGPFTLTGPRSYAILVASQSGVNVSGLSIQKFSYGIVLNGSNNDQVDNVTITNSTISGIYLYGSDNDQLNGDNVQSTGTAGGINITLGKNNTVSKSTVEYNLNTGISLANSTNDTISGTTMIGNPVDLECYGSSTASASNKFLNSSCFENSYCDFAFCSDQNKESQVTAKQLTSNVNTCGSINHAGAYVLASNLNLAKYMNISLAQGGTTPCILINSSNVYLTCNGHSIINSHYGVYADKGTFNVTVVGCNFDNDTYGLYFGNMIRFELNSIRAANNDYGVYVMASTDGNMTNITASKNSYGLYVNRTTYATLTGFHISNNTYGISIDNSTDFYLNSGVTLSNSGTDLYCSKSAYNSSLLSIQNSQCGSSDCIWAPNCPVRSLPALTPYPINGCGTLSVPGEYTLQGDIIYQKTDGCFRIDADYVDFKCNNNTIEAVNGGGTAFNLSDTANVTISDCDISGFTNGFVAYDTSGTKILSSYVNQMQQGYNMSYSTNAVLYDDRAEGFSGYGFSFYDTNDSGVYKDAAASRLPGVGFLFNRSFDNKITNNTANYSSYGFYFSDSRGNQIYNNSVFSSQTYDYYCSPNSGGLLSQRGGRVNYGLTKENCNWMVEIPLAIAQNPCRYMDTPDTIVLSQDILYTYGDSCFSLYSNANSSTYGSTIDCAGHTVYASNGGAFVSAHNSSTTLENCILIGFTNPVSFTASRPVFGLSVINNTILNTAGTAIYANGALGGIIDNNNVTNSTDGIWVNRFNGSSIQNNTIRTATDGIFVNNSEATVVMNNTINGTFSSIKVENSQVMSVVKNKVTNSKS